MKLSLLLLLLLLFANLKLSSNSLEFARVGEIAKEFFQINVLQRVDSITIFCAYEKKKKSKIRVLRL